MRYVRRVLQPGETLVYATKLHWIIYCWAILLLIICIILAGATWYMADNSNVSLALGIAAVIFALLALSSAFRAFIRYATTELAVTDRRVESVDVDQSILGRMIGYGTLIIRGTGGSLEPMRRIDNPLTFRTYITAG
jgi:Bacterial PH domain